VRIRPATPPDIDAIVELGASMHRESAYSFLPFDPGKVRGMLLDYLADAASCCIFIAECNTAPAGFLAGELSGYYFCNELVACDTALFMARQYRGSAGAAGLIRAFRDWAVSRGARELCLSISSNVHSERTGRFYEGLGFSFVGGTFKQRLGSAKLS
jgi:GNAT superfamily N-acetyltransferase